MSTITNLREAVAWVMEDNPEGMSPMEILVEIKNRLGQDVFPLVDVIDITHELRDLGYRPVGH